MQIFIFLVSHHFFILLNLSIWAFMSPKLAKKKGDYCPSLLPIHGLKDVQLDHVIPKSHGGDLY